MSHAQKSSLSMETTFSGERCSESAVKPTMSMKKTVVAPWWVTRLVLPERTRRARLSGRMLVRSASERSISLPRASKKTSRYLRWTNEPRSEMSGIKVPLTTAIQHASQRIRVDSEKP